MRSSCVVQVGSRASVVHANYIVSVTSQRGYGRLATKPAASSVLAIKQQCMQLAGLWLVPRPAVRSRRRGAPPLNNSCLAYSPEAPAPFVLRLAVGARHILGCNRSAQAVALGPRSIFGHEVVRSGTALKTVKVVDRGRTPSRPRARSRKQQS